MTPATEIRDVTVRYGSTLALRGVSLEFTAGTITGLVGPNGSGKSTLLRVLSGLERPASGWTQLAGEEYSIRRFPFAKGGVLINSDSFHPGISAVQHLRWVAIASDIRPSIAESVLSTVGLADAAYKAIGDYSFGMRQRLGLACTMLTEDCRFLLLDEPLNGLDRQGLKWLREKLKERADGGATVIVSTHLLQELSELASDVVVLCRGVVRYSGSITDLESRCETELRASLILGREDEQALYGMLGDSLLNAYRSDDGALVLVVRGLSEGDFSKLAISVGAVPRQLETKPALICAYDDLTALEVS